MKTRLLICIIFYCQFSFAQNTIIRVYKTSSIDSLIKKQKTFKFILLDSNNIKQFSGYYKERKKRGKWIFYQNNDLVIKEINFINNDISQEVLYDVYGKMEWKGLLYRGKRDGVWKKFTGRYKTYIYNKGILLSVR